MVDLQVPDNLLSIRVVDATLSAQHHLQSLGANLVVQALPLSLIPDLALGAQLDGLCQDLIDLVLLYRSHIHGAVEGLCSWPVLGLAEVPCQGLIQGDLVEPFVARRGNCPSENVDEVILLDDVGVTYLVIALEEDV